MPDTLPNIAVPTDQWIDVYAAASINPTSSVRVQNIGSVEIRYRITGTQPTDDTAFNISSPGARAIDRWIQVDGAESGLWVTSRFEGARINAQEV